MNEYIKTKLQNIPMEPGCYLMKDKSGEIIYVGKAKKLKNRVNQYFVGAHDWKTTKMVSNIDNFDFIVCGSEKEALLLEINLIKKYRPRFNIMFMDDKTYPYIRLTEQPYPMVKVVRDAKKDRKSKYFGPYPDATAAHQTVKMLEGLYPIRKCKTLPNKPCLYYHMGQCLGPCFQTIDPQEIQKVNEGIKRFFRGDVKDIRKQLKAKMNQAIQEEAFEQAAVYRDQLLAMDHVLGGQQVETAKKLEIDAFNYVSEKGYIALQGLFVRNGKLLEKEVALHPLYGEEEEEFTSYVLQYYENHPLPKEICLPPLKDQQLIKEVFQERVQIPQRGYRRKLVLMASHNAKEQLQLKFEMLEGRQSKIDEANEALSRLLKTSIHRIEIFDNSHISGTFTVASCVVFIDGKASKKDYRHYRLHTANSDVDSMKEVLYRRYFHVLKQEVIQPDLLLVDGGLPQIHAAKDVLEELGVNLLVCGLVKDDRHNTASLLNEKGDPYPIDRDSPLFFALTRMQDEAHRFAIEYHRKLRKKAQTRSILEEIEGVGEVRKKKLLKQFGSFSALKEATVEALGEVVPQEVAQRVYETLHEPNGIMDKEEEGEKA